MSDSNRKHRWIAPTVLGTAGAGGAGYLGAKYGLKAGLKLAGRAAHEGLKHEKPGVQLGGTLLSAMLGAGVGMGAGAVGGGVVGGTGGIAAGKGVNKYLEKIAEKEYSPSYVRAGARGAVEGFVGAAAGTALGGLGGLHAAFAFPKSRVAQTLAKAGPAIGATIGGAAGLTHGTKKSLNHQEGSFLLRSLINEVKNDKTKYHVVDTKTGHSMPVEDYLKRPFTPHF